jgi:hypothetical protein
MKFRRALCLVTAVAIAGCATPITPVMPAEEEYDPDTYVAPQFTPLVESPPVEPVEPALPSIAPPAPSTPPSSNPAAAAATPAAASPPVVVVPPPASEPGEDQQLLSLLADLQRFGTLSNDEVRRELTLATQALARQRTDINRVRLAVLYTLLRTPQDDQRAVQLFENVAKSPPPGTAVRQLAAVLHSQVIERQRAVRDEQQKADSAIQKLEALRAMERSLLRDRVRSGGGGGGGGGAGGSGR